MFTSSSTTLTFEASTEPREAHADDAVAADGDALRTFRDADAGLQHVTARRHHLALRRQLEAAVTRVGVGAIGHLDLEEAAALDGDIERIVGLREAALRVELFGGDHAHTGAEVHARGRHRVLRG